MQVPEEEAVLYNRDKVRRPIPEEKAITRAVDMIRVGPPFTSRLSSSCEQGTKQEDACR